MSDKEKVITLEDRIPKLQQERRQKANRRLVLYILVFFLLILVIVYFWSPLSKVGSITVSGNHFTSNETLIKATGLSAKSGFLDANPDRIAKKVEKVDEVKSALVHKHFPNDITIQVKEYPRVAYLQTDGRYYPILENGARLSALDREEVPVNAPMLVNWKKGDQLAKMASEIQKLPQPLVKRISEIDYTPSDTFPDGITAYMNDGFEVRALIDDFADKMKKYPEIISEIDSKAKGIIHMRVTLYFQKYSSKK